MSYLKKLESTIRRGQQAFFDAAKALLEIERRELWKPQFKSIVEYAAARFDFSGSDVSRYRNAGEVLERLEGFSKLPTNEAQCRALAQLRHREPQTKVWQAVLDTGKKITARLIQETAERILGGGQPDDHGGSSEPPEDRTAIHEVATAAQFLTAAKDRVEGLDEEGRLSLLSQIEIVEAQIGELRAYLSADLVVA